MGLVGRSFWIGHDQALEANPDDGIPLAKARILGPDVVGNEVELAPALADEQYLSALRVVWIRNPGDASGMATAMGRTEASIRRLIPQHGVEPTFTELLVPETLRDLEIPLPPPDWQQFVVEPQDRPSPTASDSFWDEGTPPRQGLHAALILGGILGGINLDQPAPRDAKTDAPWVVHPFTRGVRGADRARRETRALLHDRLETITAADVAPDRFHAPESPEDSEYVDDARQWLLSLDNEALRFRRPEVSFTRKGQSFVEFLFEVLTFLRWALNGMFGIQRWKDMILVVRARLARRLEADDYGATIDAGALTPKGLDLKDYDVLEDDAQATATTAIAKAARADGRIPDRVVWEGVALLVPSLIDGSAGPHGWQGRTRFDRLFVIAPRAVVRTEITVLAAASEGGGSPADDELRRVKRIGVQELARARELACIGLTEDLARFESPVGRVAKTAQTIAEQARAEGIELRESFSRSIESESPPVRTEELPLLGRVRAAVVSDLLLARFCAEQLASMTKIVLPPNTISQLRILLHNSTWVVVGALLIGVGLPVLLAHFANEIDAILTTIQTPYPTSWTQLMGWVLTAIGGVLISVFTRLFYAYHAYNEAGRRRLEYVERRADAAISAYEERNRLRNADRILSAWGDILSSLVLRDDETQQPLAQVPGDLPDALQIAEPDIDDEDLQRLIVQVAVEPGWFGDALDGLFDHELSKDAREQVWSDAGMLGGPLSRVLTSALDGGFQREWWDGWATRTADKAVAKLADETRSVRALAARRTDTISVKDFRAEITRTMSPEYQPGSDYQELFDASESGQRLVARARQGTREFALTPPLTSIDTVLIFRRLGRVADETHDDDAAHVDPEWGSA